MKSVSAISKKGRGETPRYSALLRPHRSLDRQGFLILMIAISFVSFVAGVAFLLLGAWPVFGFFGLDVLLIYWAFRKNYAEARNFETVELYDEELVVRRESKGRPAEEWCFHPFWVRVQLEKDEELEICGPLWLTSHGKRLQLGAFLGADTLRVFSEELKLALAGLRKNL